MTVSGSTSSAIVLIARGRDSNRRFGPDSTLGCLARLAMGGVDLLTDMVNANH